MMTFFRILMLVGAFLSLFGGIASKDDGGQTAHPDGADDRRPVPAVHDYSVKRGESP